MKASFGRNLLQHVAMVAIALAVFWAFPAQAACTVSFSQSYRHGLDLARQGEYRSAVRVWRHLLVTGRDDLSSVQQARLCLAMTLACERLGKTEAACKCLAEAARLAPGSDAVRKAEERILGGRGEKSFDERLDEAAGLLANALLAENVASGQGKALFLEATPVFREALEKGIRLAFSHYALGACLLHTDSDLREAQRHLHESLRRDPENGAAHHQMAELARRNGDVQAEVDHLEQCVFLGRESPSVLTALVRSYGRRNAIGDGAKVLDLVRKLVDDDPSYGNGLVEAIGDEHVRTTVERIVGDAVRLDDRKRRDEEMREKRRQVQYDIEEARRERLRRADEEVRSRHGQARVLSGAKGYRQQRRLRALTILHRRQIQRGRYG